MKRTYTAVILLAAIIMTFLIFSWTAPRFSRFYFSLGAISIVPLIIWRSKALAPALIAVFLMNLLLTIPVDLVFRSGNKFALAILPVSFGIVEKPGTVGYGCVIWKNPPKYAVLINF